MRIDLSTTALFVTDPQNDFLSEEQSCLGTGRSDRDEAQGRREREEAEGTRKRDRYPGLLLHPSCTAPKDFKDWKSLNGIDKIMFENKMFLEGTWGHDYHPELKPDSNTVVMNPHKGLSNFWTWRRRYPADGSMGSRRSSCTACRRTCVLSHTPEMQSRTAFDLIIVADATAAAGDAAYEAALTNFEFLAHEVVTTEQIVKRLKSAKK